MAKLQVCSDESGECIVLIMTNKGTLQSVTFGCIECLIVRVQQDGKLAPTGNSIPFSQPARAKSSRTEIYRNYAKRTNIHSPRKYIFSS